MSMLAYADLTITNNSSEDSTSVINGNKCSSIVLGEKGITRAHSTNVVDNRAIVMACITSPFNCKADVYMTANCTGEKIATAYLHTKNGIDHVEMSSNKYSIVAPKGSWNITLNPN